MKFLENDTIAAISTPIGESGIGIVRISGPKALEIVINYGARMAEPGEFTKRSFLNGRIDLSQAEAVIDLIQAKTERSLSSSLAQLGGSLKKKIEDLRNRVIRISAEIEAPMDFPDQDIKEINPKKVEENISYILKEINSLIETMDYGKILKEGINALIVGKANVGKSSLFNTLLRENRAIVTHIPGTTRDTIEELINIKGIAFKIIDTAGLKNPENIIEKISIKKMMKYLRETKLILAVFDVSVPLSLEDEEVIKEINKEKNKSKKVIVIENKIDL